MDWKQILLLAVLPIIVCTEAKVILDETVPECHLEQSSLYCYFENSDIQEVYLEPPDKTIKDIYVQHVKKLHLDESVCTNVTFYNITEIVTEGEKDEQCENGFNLLAMISSLNKIPENVKKISLKFSNITSLATDRSLEELSVKNSIIEVLRIFGTFENNSKVVFEESRIVKTEKLILDAGSEFIVKESSFEDVPEESILLHPNVTKVVERVSGDFKYADLMTSRNNQDLLANNSNKDFGFIIIDESVVIGVFILLLICLVSIVIYKLSHKKPQNQCTDVESGVSDSKSTNLSEQNNPLLCPSDQNSFSSSQESSVNLDTTRSESEQSEPKYHEPIDEESEENNQNGNTGRASLRFKRNYPEREDDSHELLGNAIELTGNEFDKKLLLEVTKNKSLTLNDTGTHYMKENKEIKQTDTDELQSKELLSTVSHKNSLTETKTSRNDNENNEKIDHKEIEEDMKLNKSEEEDRRTQIILEYIHSILRHHQLINPEEIRTIYCKQRSISVTLKTPLSNQDTYEIKTCDELTNFINSVLMKISSNETISDCNNRTGNKHEISGNYGDDDNDKQLDISFQVSFDNRDKPKATKSQTDIHDLCNKRRAI